MPTNNTSNPVNWTTDREGFVYDVTTGELHGITEPKTGEVIWISEEGKAQAEPRTETETAFKVRDINDVNWVLKLRMHAENELASIRHTREAINENLDGMARDQQRRLEGLDWRFNAELEEWTTREIEQNGGRSKTVKTPFGKLSFRLNRGTNQILDHNIAIAFVDDWKPELIKKSVGIKDVAAAIEEATDQMGEKPNTDKWFLTSEPRESFSITTGIKF